MQGLEFVLATIVVTGQVVRSAQGRFGEGAMAARRAGGGPRRVPGGADNRVREAELEVPAFRRRGLDLQR